MDKKAAIIIRCRDKLEYTIQTIQSIIDNTEYSHEIVVIDNGSTDGSEQWLRYMVGHSERYKNLRAIFSGDNLGDYGGLVYGLDHIDPESKYVLQHDNDVSVYKGWLTDMVYALENTEYESIQLKRTGVKNVVKATNIKKVGELEVGKVPFNVMCWIMKTVDFEKHMDKVGRCRDLGKMGHVSCGKIVNRFAHHIDGWEPTEFKQIEKYDRKKTWQGFDLRRGTHGSKEMW